MSKRDDDDLLLSKMLKALGHPNRLRLFEEIRKAGATRMAEHGCLLGQIVQKI